MNRQQGYNLLNQEINRINSCRKLGEQSQFEWDHIEGEGFEVYTVKHYYGGDGFMAGRGAWSEKRNTKKVVFKGKGEEVLKYLKKQAA